MFILICGSQNRSILYRNANFKPKYIAAGPENISPTDLFDGVLWVDSPSQRYPGSGSVFSGAEYRCYANVPKNRAFNENNGGYDVLLKWNNLNRMNPSQAQIVYNTIDSYKKSPRYLNALGQHNYYQGIYEISKEDFLKICAPQGEKREAVQEQTTQFQESPCITIKKGEPCSFTLKFCPDSDNMKTVMVTVNIALEEK